MAYVIKRYSNRKLYDTQQSRYVTLEQLEEMIRAGKEIRVLDAATGEDLTSVTLAHILLESERTRPGALPATFLHQLIKYGDAWQGFLQRSLRASLEGIITSQKQADRIFSEWTTRAGWASPRSDPEARPDRAPTKETDTLREEIDGLKQQLRALEKKLGRKRKK